MITVEQALALVEKEASPLPAVELPLIEARGRVLAEEIRADRDDPPFDKALVDGYALRATDLGDPPVLRIGETIVAGQTPSRPLGPAEAALVMTGAPVPPATDAVVMHEETETTDGQVRFSRPVHPGQNLLVRGRVHRAGDVVLTAGARISPAGLGLLASVGRTRVRVIPRPTLAVLPTGDELVEPGQVPGPGQIRNSNATMLQALALEEGADVRVLPTAPDEPGRLSELLRQGLGQDVLVISGGVSAGQRDLVPAALERLEVRPVFHKIRLKPGKPLWFGVGPKRGEQPGTLVFGLPGNPVSSLVGFLIFVRPALAALAGLAREVGGNESGELAIPFAHRGDRPTYHPARRVGARPTCIEPLGWAGSADLATVARSDGFAVFPAGDRTYQAGETLPFLPLSRSTE